MRRTIMTRMLGLALLTAAAITPSISQAGNGRGICDIAATSFEMWVYQLFMC